jgi:hypothetical protein
VSKPFKQFDSNTMPSALPMDELSLSEVITLAVELEEDEE